EGATILVPWTADWRDVEEEVGRGQLVAAGEEQFVLLNWATEIETELPAAEIRLRDLKCVFLDEIFVLEEPECRSLPLVRASPALGADDVRAGARILGVVRIHIDAELIDRLLRERRSRLAETDDVAIVQALHLHAVHVDVEEAEIRSCAARGQCSTRLRCVRLD